MGVYSEIDMGYEDDHPFEVNDVSIREAADLQQSIAASENSVSSAPQAVEETEDAGEAEEAGAGDAAPFFGDQYGHVLAGQRQEQYEGAKQYGHDSGNQIALQVFLHGWTPFTVSKRGCRAATNVRHGIPG